jgi:hypothetical protein
MSIIDDLEAMQETYVAGCKICYYLDTIDHEKARKLREALDKPKVYNHTRLAEVFTKNGMPTSETAIRRHRKLHRKNHGDNS